MNQTTLMYIMSGSVLVSAVAIVVQVLILFGMYRRMKPAVDEMAKLGPKVGRLVEDAQATIEQSRKQIAEVTTGANDVIATTKVQLARVDEILKDATTRARVQMDRVELVLDDTFTRLHQTIVLLHNGVLQPLRQVNGVIAGIRSALAYLLRGGRPTVAQATSDEEMFI